MKSSLIGNNVIDSSSTVTLKSRSKVIGHQNTVDDLLEKCNLFMLEQTQVDRDEIEK